MAYSFANPDLTKEWTNWSGRQANAPPIPGREEGGVDWRTAHPGTPGGLPPGVGFALGGQVSGDFMGYTPPAQGRSGFTQFKGMRTSGNPYRGGHMVDGVFTSNRMNAPGAMSGMMNNTLAPKQVNQQAIQNQRNREEIMAGAGVRPGHFSGPNAVEDMRARGLGGSYVMPPGAATNPRMSALAPYGQGGPPPQQSMGNQGPQPGMGNSMNGSPSPGMVANFNAQRQANIQNMAPMPGSGGTSMNGADWVKAHPNG